MAEPEILDLPPHEAIDRFRAKGLHIGFAWQDTDAATHLESFTVAKAANLDLLRDIRAAVDRALAEGVSFDDFRAELQPLLERRGWWGRREMTDPRTGETVEVQLGSARRLETIFRANLAASYARGRWERIERLAEDRPFLRYSAVLDERVRPDHAQWHGVVLRVDDPWWRTHYPPNGWRCRCIVTQHDADSLARNGFEPSPTRPAHEGMTRAWHNERTGEDVRVPIGVDPGWDHNVGRQDSVRAARSILVEKVADAPVAVAQAALSEGWDSYAAAGRAVRETISNAIPGAPGETAHALAFRERLTATLQRRRGAGEIEADVEPALPSAANDAAAEAVRDASRIFPRRWVEAANSSAIAVRNNHERSGGTYYRPGIIDYRPKDGGSRALAIVPDPSLSRSGTDLHEYVHHLQQAMPRLNDLFVGLHRARTHNDPVVPLKGYKRGVTGREDKYIDPYIGREYDGDPREVITKSYQILLADRRRLRGMHVLARLLQDDPELTDLAIGALMRYDP